MGKFAPRGLAGPDYHRLNEEPARGLGRQGIEDGLQGRSTRHPVETLTVREFRLDSQGFGFG
jgi:hypothetical protein